MGADVLQRLLVLAVFIAGVVEEGLDALTAVIFLAVRAGDAAFSQAAFLHPTLCPAQITGAVQVSRFAALTGFQILAAGAAVGAVAADLFHAAHWDALPSE